MRSSLRPAKSSGARPIRAAAMCRAAVRHNRPPSRPSPAWCFPGGLDGHLRAYATSDGRIIWDVDTAKDYGTVNGVAAHGGSLDGPGAVVVDGMLYVNSGYGFFGTAPGNALLAFSIDGK